MERLLSRYERMEQRIVGEGASGIVIKAKDTVTGQYVSIKRPNPMLILPKRRKKSSLIEREGKALELLLPYTRKCDDKHAIACQHIESGKWPHSDDRYLVTAWAQGRQVEEWLQHPEELEQTGGVIPQGEALTILLQLAGLLKYAHSQNIMHNDIEAKHLFWHRRQRQLTVIDWANCTLPEDEKPIATITTDLKQYGELVHRLLTGLTLGEAIRWGGESDWRIAMHERNIPEPLQEIVAGAIGCDGKSYACVDELWTDLEQFKRHQEIPILTKVEILKILFDQDKIVLVDRLNELEELLTEVETWDPTLVIQQRDQFPNLRRELIILGCKNVAEKKLFNGEYDAVKTDIIRNFGPDLSEMPHTLRPMYLFADCLDTTRGEDHRIIKQAMEAFFGWTNR